MDVVLALSVSMMRRNLPLGSTVSPTESSAARKRRKASSGVMSWGAITVTFLLLAGMVPGRRNCLHEIDEMRSPSSVSGFRFSFTMRLPAGNFRQELNSFSPGRSPPPLGAVAAGGGAGGAMAGDGGGGGGAAEGGVTAGTVTSPPCS